MASSHLNFRQIECLESDQQQSAVFKVQFPTASLLLCKDNTIRHVKKNLTGECTAWYICHVQQCAKNQSHVSRQSLFSAFANISPHAKGALLHPAQK